MNNTHASRTRYLVELALMVTIIFVMAFTPLGYFRTLGLSITFLTVPVAVGAMILGPVGRCDLRTGIRYHQFYAVLRYGCFRNHVIQHQSAGNRSGMYRSETPGRMDHRTDF